MAAVEDIEELESQEDGEGKRTITRWAPEEDSYLLANARKESWGNIERSLGRGKGTAASRWQTLATHCKHHFLCGDHVIAREFPWWFSRFPRTEPGDELQVCKHCKTSKVVHLWDASDAASQVVREAMVKDGLVEHPTLLLVGEPGPELVVPLPAPAPAPVVAPQPEPEPDPAAIAAHLVSRERYEEAVKMGDQLAQMLRQSEDDLASERVRVERLQAALQEAASEAERLHTENEDLRGMVQELAGENQRLTKRLYVMGLDQKIAEQERLLEQLRRERASIPSEDN